MIRTWQTGNSISTPPISSNSDNEQICWAYEIHGKCHQLEVAQLQLQNVYLRQNGLTYMCDCIAASLLHVSCRSICNWDQNWIKRSKPFWGGWSRDQGDLQTGKKNTQGCVAAIWPLTFGNQAIKRSSTLFADQKTGSWPQTLLQATFKVTGTSSWIKLVCQKLACTTLHTKKLLDIYNNPSLQRAFRYSSAWQKAAAQWSMSTNFYVSLLALLHTECRIAAFFYLYDIAAGAHEAFLKEKFSSSP